MLEILDISRNLLTAPDLEAVFRTGKLRDPPRPKEPSGSLRAPPRIHCLFNRLVCLRSADPLSDPSFGEPNTPNTAFSYMFLSKKGTTWCSRWYLLRQVEKLKSIASLKELCIQAGFMHFRPLFSVVGS